MNYDPNPLLITAQYLFQPIDQAILGASSSQDQRNSLLIYKSMKDRLVKVEEMKYAEIIFKTIIEKKVHQA